MISVIMSTYNETEEQLRTSIESILNQTYKDIEYIIILDKPENELHRNIISEYVNKDNRIIFSINDKNLGLTDSLNKGIGIASGDYIARMDADDISIPERLKKQYEYITKNNYDLIGGITQMIDENGDLIYSITRVPTDPNKIRKILKYGQVIAHPTWLGKAEVFKELNGYRHMPLCEDYDFTLRASLKGYKISNLNEVVLHYRMTSNSISRKNLYEQYLYLVYVSSCYAKGEIANIPDAMKFVSTNVTKKDSEKYLKSNVLFNTMLSQMSNKEFIPFIKNGIMLTFNSTKFLNKIYRFFRLSIASR